MTLSKPPRTPPSGRWFLGVATGLLAIGLLTASDLLTGPGPQYIGVLACAPLLTSFLAGPRGTAVVSLDALAAGAGTGSANTST